MRLRRGHLCEHRFRHGFKEKLNPVCSFSIEAETTAHCFLRCYFKNVSESTIMNDYFNVAMISFMTKRFVAF